MDAGRVEEPSPPLSAGVAVFVKTPGLSPVKTRLAAALGAVWTERAYRLAAACVAETLAASGLPAYWAVAEEDGCDHALWSGLPCLPQGTGTLGARMANVHPQLTARHGAGIFVGADLPQLEIGDLTAAAAWLAGGDTRHAIGPARDGGFWLYGGNRIRPRAAWCSVRYSQEDTARQFVRAIGPGGWKRLPLRTDLDRACDVAAVRSELSAAGLHAPARRRLAEWLTAAPLPAA
mgnify:CR=1 FL=1